MRRVEVGSQGPRNARVMIVGEAPGQTEIEQGAPFMGVSGIELTRMLKEAGFDRKDCYVTNVCRVQPPRNEIKQFFLTKTDAKGKGVLPLLGRYPLQPVRDGLEILERDIREIDPDLILALGDTALWATTGYSGITKWRGSVLQYGADFERHGFKISAGWDRPKVVPTYHPAAILRQYAWRFPGVEDFRRAKRELSQNGRRVVEPAYNFKIRPSFGDVVSYLSSLQQLVENSVTWLACDIETQRFRFIDCIGFATSRLDAFCIPFLQCDVPGKPFYWSLEEEKQIILMLRDVLTHPNCHVIGQNFLYDQQYIIKWWGFIPNLKWDTMTIHHSMFCLLPKGLDFQSSLYCDFHRFWKEDAKGEDDKRLSDEDQWIYNCRDNAVTFEVKEKQELLLQGTQFPVRAGLTPQERQMSLHKPVLRAMLKGVRSDEARRKEVAAEVRGLIDQREKYINKSLGHPLNVRSPKQLQTLFYHDFGMKQIISRKTKKPTCDEEALQKLAKRDPLLAPLCEFINDIRSLGTYANVCEMPLDKDQRFRCSYILPGTDTYRFASKSDAFGYGSNLQNITSGTEDLDEVQLALAVQKGILLKPNLRKMFIPDEGYTIVEYDLPQADAQVVAWTAGDEQLKAIFRDPNRDLHIENAKTIFGDCTGKHDPRRQAAKAGVHATNYLVTARTLAAALGITIAQAQKFIDIWFRAHPKIQEWHDRTRFDMQTKSYTENIFGYRRYCFDRIEEDLKHAIAWEPQSTVAIITNTGISRVEETLSSHGVDFLLQVHDSAVFQIWTKDGPELAKKIRDCMVVECPFEDPLAMVPDAKFSEHSWGECERRPEWLQAA